ncbi:hypothetical protein GQ44DRAFT_701592, partial [Phaeosphaeriaceae sp. PMI808]
MGTGGFFLSRKHCVAFLGVGWDEYRIGLDWKTSFIYIFAIYYFVVNCVWFF